MIKSTKTIVSIILIILFLCCLLDMPYGYFLLVRCMGMTGFLILAYHEKDKKDKTLMIIWICSALLINPFFKIALGRMLWNIADVLWSIGLLATLIIDYRKGKQA